MMHTIHFSLKKFVQRQNAELQQSQMGEQHEDHYLDFRGSTSLGIYILASKLNVFLLLVSKMQQHL